MSEKQEKNLKDWKLPANESEDIPRDILSVDIIDPYKIRREGHDEHLTLEALTIIDSETG